MFLADTLCNEVKKNGFAICEDVLPPEQITALLGSMGEISDYGSLQKRGATFAIRNLLDSSLEVRELANSDVVRRIVHIDFAAVKLPDGMRWFSEKS